MHLSALLLSVSFASAQYAQQFGPGPGELEYLKNINGGSNDNQHQNQNQGQSYNNNGNGNYGNYEVGYDDYENTAPTPHTPIRAPASSPAVLIHSTFVVRPSQAPFARSYPQAPAPGYAYNHPSPDISAHQVHQTPAPRHQESAPQGRSQNFGPGGHDVPVGASGGLAPIDPLRPDSQVAPPPLFPNQHHGKDEGNSFCMGKCFAHESDAKCAKPYVSFSFSFSCI
ncbi:unnamed protein product [Penicillium egyptiacum]|uniref:Uncharacterized protein n=1 Tax=Penicillium egyptiacum TaxID=1303716 RepID=A0A9W4P435_9EURO|nr:unnamed protein product [Penicillium egyptiacum]